mmetsp:Transcript_24308/g.67718  ORF Transcript_24308/g.67718 Transcript_24308/m.67718 type:complete len:101 (-) Transcript_24308:49-351(-)
MLGHCEPRKPRVYNHNTSRGKSLCRKECVQREFRLPRITCGYNRQVCRKCDHRRQCLLGTNTCSGLGNSDSSTNDIIIREQKSARQTPPARIAPKDHCVI